MSNELLRDLNRAKAAFQLRAIMAALQIHPERKNQRQAIERWTMGPSVAVRVGEASADLPATSEHMDVTAGETAPNSSRGLA